MIKVKRDWLWDRKISIAEVKKILKNPEHKDFVVFSSLLLSRKNDTREVFKEYINPIMFCRQWSKIKRYMRKDKWSNPRIVFWQAIYEKLLEKYHKKGFQFRKRESIVVNDLCKNVGIQIRNNRKEQRLSQKMLAKKMKISQQLISRIEKGKENISLKTLTEILKALNKNIDIILK